MKDIIHLQAACRARLTWRDQLFPRLLVPSTSTGKPLLRLFMSLYLLCIAA